jgi:hypothetical protein
MARWPEHHRQRGGEEIAHSAADKVGRIGDVVDAGVAGGAVLPASKMKKTRGVAPSKQHHHHLHRHTTATLSTRGRQRQANGLAEELEEAEVHGP